MSDGMPLFDQIWEPAWILVDDGQGPLRARDVEARLSIGNGFLGMRGARDLGRGPAWVSATPSLLPLSWPRSYIAGLYDTPDVTPGVPVLMPVPDWTRLRLRLGGRTLRGTPMQMLDLRRSVLLSDWQAEAGLQLRSLRLISMADRATALQVVEITAQSDHEITLDAWFDTALIGLHPRENAADVRVWCGERSDLCVAMAASAKLSIGERNCPPTERGNLYWNWHFSLKAGESALFERCVGVARGETGVAQSAQTALARTQIGWQASLAAHAAAWTQRWQASEVVIEGDDDAQRILRFVVHALSIASNPDDPTVSIGARGMTGDGYLGHVFWDTEIYMLPFFSLTWPEAAHALLRYRHSRLPGARAKAASLGYRGAMFPWESADTGMEETPDQVIGVDGLPAEVLTGKQEQHITADIAYAIWQHWLITGDEDFLRDEAAEILVETARFWVSRVERDAEGICHISGVIGPDEFHESVGDNAYTNEMARWNIARGLEVVEKLHLDVDASEVEQWRDVMGKIALNRSSEGVFEQHSGFFTALPNAKRGAKDIKQADVVALVGLLPELFDGETASRNFSLYEARCAHESSLSRPMHAIVAARLGETARALEFFRDAAALDLRGPIGSDTAGLHMAAIGGLWQAAVLGFGGVSWPGGELHVAPNLPPGWNRLGFRLQFQGRQIGIDITAGGVELQLVAGSPLDVVVAGKSRRLLAHA